jgi:hypothetical protein
MSSIKILEDIGLLTFDYKDHLYDLLVQKDVCHTFVETMKKSSNKDVKVLEEHMRRTGLGKTIPATVTEFQNRFTAETNAAHAAINAALIWPCMKGHEQNPPKDSASSGKAEKEDNGSWKRNQKVNPKGKGSEHQGGGGSTQGKGKTLAPNVVGKATRKCFACGKEDHVKAACPFAKHPDANKSTTYWDLSEQGKAYKAKGYSSLEPTKRANGAAYNWHGKWNDIPSLLCTSRSLPHDLHQYTIPAVIKMNDTNLACHFILDTGCLQDNFISTAMAKILLGAGVAMCKCDKTVCSGLLVCVRNRYVV